jgi:hypothetical protein
LRQFEKIEARDTKQRVRRRWNWRTLARCCKICAGWHATVPKTGHTFLAEILTDFSPDSIVSRTTSRQIPAPSSITIDELFTFHFFSLLPKSNRFSGHLKSLRCFVGAFNHCEKFFELFLIADNDRHVSDDAATCSEDAEIDGSVTDFEINLQLVASCVEQI